MAAWWQALHMGYDAPKPQSDDRGYKPRSMEKRLKRPTIDNKDGTYSSESTITLYQEPEFNAGKATVIPTVWDGKHHTDNEARRHYKETGVHFGVFNSLADSERNITATHAILERNMDRVSIARGLRGLTRRRR